MYGILLLNKKLPQSYLFKTTQMYFTVSGRGLAGSSASGSFRRLQWTCQPGMGSCVRLDGELICSKRMVVVKIQFFAGLRPSASCWVLARSNFSFLPVGLSIWQLITSKFARVGVSWQNGSYNVKWQSCNNIPLSLAYFIG